MKTKALKFGRVYFKGDRLVYEGLLTGRIYDAKTGKVLKRNPLEREIFREQRRFKKGKKR